MKTQDYSATPMKTAWVMTSCDGPQQKFLFLVQVTRRRWTCRWTENIAEAIRFKSMRECRVMATALGLHPEVSTIEVPLSPVEVNATVETGGMKWMWGEEEDRIENE